MGILEITNKMDYLKSLYPQVREITQNSIPNYWSELRYILKEFFEEPIMPEAILPLASCQAVHGNPQDAVAISAALITAAACLRLLDDLEDQDRPGKLWEQVGTARTWNYACAVHTVSFKILNRAYFPAQVFQQINQYFIDAFLRIAAGQDRDLAGVTKTIEDYWATVEMKIASGYATACATGAMAGTENPKLIQACGTFGHHLGLAIQILNDMESIWQPDGITDLKQGKITLPLIYGLQSEHPEREELMSLVAAKEIATHANRIKEILDHIGLRALSIRLRN